MNPNINDAKELAKKYKKDMIIIFHINNNGEFGYASYGKNKKFCKVAKTISDVFFKKLNDSDSLIEIIKEK